MASIISRATLDAMSKTAERPSNGDTRLETTQIYDIRQHGDNPIDLRKELVTGLTGSREKNVPSLLLWDEQGQQHFEDILHCPEYYPVGAELKLFDQHSDSIAASVKPNSIIIELGAGNCKKTLTVLSALERKRKPVVYLALDVAADALAQSVSTLARLTSGFQHVVCHGLLGTYEDCATLLSREDLFHGQDILFLWFGTSITNLPWDAAADLLRRLLCHKHCSAEMLVTVDGCQDLEMINLSYDIPTGQIRSFVRNGLVHANRLLDSEVFNLDDWDFERCFDPQTRDLNLYHVAKKDMTLHVDGQDIPVVKGERVHAITSAKWTVEDVERLSASAGVVIGEKWIGPRANIGCYLLRSN